MVIHTQLIRVNSLNEFQTAERIAKNYITTTLNLLNTTSRDEKIFSQVQVWRKTFNKKKIAQHNPHVLSIFSLETILVQG